MKILFNLLESVIKAAAARLQEAELHPQGVCEVHARGA